MLIEWTKRLYRREGFRRLGIVLGCVASIAWALLFSNAFRKSWSGIVETHAGRCVAGSTPADVVAKRLDARIPTSVHGDALVDEAVRDDGFRKLTPDEQLDVLEYLGGGTNLFWERGTEFIGSEGLLESELEQRLGPRPYPAHNPLMPPEGPDIDTQECVRSALNVRQLLTLSAGLLVGSVIAFTALVTLFAGVDWVVAGFE